GRPAVATGHFRTCLQLDPDNGRVAQRLQRALEAQQAKPTPKAKAAESKATVKAHAKRTTRQERAEARQRRKAERELGVRRGSHDPIDGTLQSLPRWRRLLTLLVLASLVALLVWSRVR
ncbi:MAG TPA: hypothetical protein VF320_00145, partial [Acidimicrobiales bacterium]